MADEQDELLYRIALTMVPNVGSVIAKNLVAYCGSAKQVFKSSADKLKNIPDVGQVTAESIKAFDDFGRAEAELAFIEKHDVKCLFFTDPDYPQRLKHCNDSPAMIHCKGTFDANNARAVGIVGTRKATDYGREMTRRLVEELKNLNVIVVSGLAYGIDVCAHQAALEFGIPTVAVLAHGLNRIYPPLHKKTAFQMLENGGLITEYHTTDNFTSHNFPQRNRIVAGLCDCLVVVESSLKGGALITANIAHSYNRDVFAFPGRVGDKSSAGCNYLMKTYKAVLIESAADLCTAMNWSTEKPTVKKQLSLPVNLSPEQKAIYDILLSSETSIDELSAKTQLRTSQLAEQLLMMEMEGWVIAKPGKVYKLAT